MTEHDPLPGFAFEPDREKTIHGVEALKVYFDPLRLRIVQEIADQPRSIHQIADALGLPFTRLYYHITLMERFGFIRHVETKRGAGAIEEKFYRVAARFFAVDRSLMTPGTPVGDAGLEAVLDAVLEGSRQSVYAGIAAGVIDTAKRGPDPDALIVARGVFSLTPELAIEFQTRLKDLILDMNARQLSSLEGTRPYNFAVVLNPTVLDDDGDHDETGHPRRLTELG